MKFKLTGGSGEGDEDFEDFPDPILEIPEAKIPETERKAGAEEKIPRIAGNKYL
jgi:hypothetical protein